MLRRPSRYLPVLLLAGAASAVTTVNAAELGDARVSSHIGQQLVADIELTLLDDAATPVQVRLASPEVYGGAGLAPPPVLSSLSLSVMRRDGRQFLHATTLRPVDADHLHLYLELSERGQRVVRLATLWLTPDPNPAPVVVASASAPAPAPAHAPAAPVAAIAPAPLAGRAPRMERSASASAPAPAPAPTSVSAHAHAREAEPVAAPAPARPAPATAPSILPPLPLRLHASAAPKIAALAPHGAAQPGACTQGGEAQACAGLGAKNAELRDRIGQLEERVKGLQARLGTARKDAPAQPGEAAKPEAHETRDAHEAHGAKPAAQDAKAAATAGPTPGPKPDPRPEPKAAAPKADAPSPAAAPMPAPQPGSKPESKPAPKSEPQPQPQPAPKPAPEVKPPPPPPGPKPISSIKPLVPHKLKAAPPPDDELPWGMVGAGLVMLAALGGAAVLLKARASKPRNAGSPPAPGKLATLRQRFFTRNEAGAIADPLAEPAVEPTLE